ncbi:MAG: endonuclease [Hahellaceae bacterium]|nr:endonuclease [Hahellaceae bacterium]
MFKFTTLSVVLVSALSTSVVAQTKFSDPKETIKSYFWGELYKEGGTTFYCKKSFSKPSVLIQESYIYDTSWVRDHLRCGTPRQYRSDNELYGQIASDLHNIVPADGRFELKRKNAKFEDLGNHVAESECGTRRLFQVMEPPADVKGDIARAIFYMHATYNLPLIGNIDQLKRWHNQDPPSPEEIERNKRITEIQGNDNPFISDPKFADTL